MGEDKEKEEKTFQEFPQILINRSNSLAQEIASYQKGLQVPANDWVVNNVVQNKKVLESSTILDTHQLIVPFLTVKALKAAFLILPPHKLQIAIK